MLKVRLSGGPDREHFEGFRNKVAVQKFIDQSFDIKFQFVQGSTKADYIIVPNTVNLASKSAATSGGKQLNLDEFIDAFTSLSFTPKISCERASRKRPSRKKASRKKASRKKASRKKVASQK